MTKYLNTGTAEELHALALAGGKDADVDFLLRVSCEVNGKKAEHMRIRLESTGAPEPCTICGLTIAAGEHVERVKGRRGGRHPACGLRMRRASERGRG